MISQFRNLLAKHFIRPVAEELRRTRTDEGEPLFEVDHQDQVGEALEQAAAEFFLLRELPLHAALFRDVDQRSLVTDDIS